MFQKFKKALLRDKEELELSQEQLDENFITSTYKIPQDLDLEKRNTSIIQRLAQQSD